MFSRIVSALIMNMDMTMYFFVIPYHAAALGASEFEVGLITALHSGAYVITSYLYSLHWKNKRGQRDIKWIMPLLSAVYLASCFASNHYIYYPMVLLHALCHGVYWPGFWASHKDGKVSGEKEAKSLADSFIWLTLAMIIGPMVAGFAYPVLGKYILLCAAGLLLPIWLADLWKNRRREYGQEREEMLQQSAIEGLPWTRLSEIEKKTLVISSWAAIFVIGFVDGTCRSVGAFFMQREGHGEGLWGTLLAVRLAAQVVATMAIKRKNPEHLVQTKLTRWYIAAFGSIFLGVMIMYLSGSVALLILAMGWIGAGFGFIYYASVYISVLGTADHGKNLSGVAECILGLGVLIGALISGTIGTQKIQNPFIPINVLIILVILSIVAVFRHRIYKKIQKK